MKILKFNSYSNNIDMAKFFINSLIKQKINEENNYDEILNKLCDELKFNFGLITTFGTGIGFMYPIVDTLIKKSKLSVNLTPENLILLTVTSLSILYLEERKNNQKILCPGCRGNGCKSCKNRGYLKKEYLESGIKSLLEELKLRGIGNGIVKKLTECFVSISNIIRIIFKHSDKVILDLISMFGYTTLLIPTINAIMSMIDKYDLNLDTLSGNFLSLSVGITTIVSKQGIEWLFKKLKRRLNLKGNNPKGQIDIINDKKTY